MYETLTLSALPLGESAYVARVSARPSMERRLTDLGLIPGTRVTCLARSPAGDPCAYLIRGALIALRRSDSDGILLKKTHSEAVAT